MNWALESQMVRSTHIFSKDPFGTYRRKMRKSKGEKRSFVNGFRVHRTNAFHSQHVLVHASLLFFFSKRQKGCGRRKQHDYDYFHVRFAAFRKTSRTTDSVHVRSLFLSEVNAGHPSFCQLVNVMKSSPASSRKSLLSSNIGL